MLSSRFSSVIERIGSRFLHHTCTVVSYVDTEEVDDETGQPVYEEATTTNVPCLFVMAETTTTNEVGSVVQKTPTIYFRASQTIADGDLIRNVVAKNGTTVLLVSAKISKADVTAEGGNPTLKMYELEGATI